MDKKISLKDKMIAKWNNNKTLDEVDVIVEERNILSIDFKMLIIFLSILNI